MPQPKRKSAWLCRVIWLWHQRTLRLQPWKAPQNNSISQGTVLRKSVPHHADTVSHRPWQPLCWQGTANYKIQNAAYICIYIKHISSYPAGERGCYKWCVARSRLAHFWVGLIHLPSMKERVCPQGAHRTAQDALAAVRLTTFIKCSDWQASLGSLWHLVPRLQLRFSRDSEQWYMRESRMPHWMANKVGKKILLQSTQGRK